MRQEPEIQLPDHVTVRYVKNGPKGRWWRRAKEDGQVHGGWSYIPAELLCQPLDLPAIESIIRARSHDKRQATRDFNELRILIEESGRHVWVTLEEGCLWWCTLRGEVTPTPEGEGRDAGHFWLPCNRPWSNRSLGGRLLAIQDLPGTVTRTAGYRGTICEADATILRLLQDKPNPVAACAARARAAYAGALESAVRELNPKDFEQLIDLLLVRCGWHRESVLGKTVEGIDLEVRNLAADELAFVQVKCSAGQTELDDYRSRFAERRNRYDRMIFAVHSPAGRLVAPEDEPVRVWTAPFLAELIARVGLGEWVEARLA